MSKKLPAVSISMLCPELLVSIPAYPQQNLLEKHNDTKQLEIQGAVVTGVIDGDTIEIEQGAMKKRGGKMTSQTILIVQSVLTIFGFIFGLGYPLFRYLEVARDNEYDPVRSWFGEKWKVINRPD